METKFKRPGFEGMIATLAFASESEGLFHWLSVVVQRCTAQTNHGQRTGVDVVQSRPAASAKRETRVRPRHPTGHQRTAETVT